MTIGTWLRSMAVVGGLGVGSASALAASVAAPVAVEIAAEQTDAPSDTETAPAEEPCDKAGKKENLGAKIRVWRAEGLRGEELAAAIHAEHLESGKVQGAEHSRARQMHDKKMQERAKNNRPGR